MSNYSKILEELECRAGKPQSSCSQNFYINDLGALTVFLPVCGKSGAKNRGVQAREEHFTAVESGEE